VPTLFGMPPWQKIRCSNVTVLEYARVLGASCPNKIRMSRERIRDPAVTAVVRDAVQNFFLPDATATAGPGRELQSSPPSWGLSRIVSVRGGVMTTWGARG
jgi:hypothetical protein